MTCEPDQFEAGERVRFTTGPLGVLDDENKIKFRDETVHAGDEGRYQRPHLHLHLDDWHLVAVGDLADERLVPCHRSHFERIVEASS